jgi:hypothetical protein
MAVARELVGAAPGIYSVGFTRRYGRGHEWAFIKEPDGQCYLIDDNRGVRYYPNQSAIEPDLAKQYPMGHPKYLGGKHKFSYLQDLGFDKVALTRRIPCCPPPAD